MASAQYEERVTAPAPEFDDYAPIFYIGQHESKRALPVSEYVLEKARNIGDTGVSQFFPSVLNWEHSYIMRYSAVGVLQAVLNNKSFNMLVTIQSDQEN